MSMEMTRRDTLKTLLIGSGALAFSLSGKKTEAQDSLPANNTINSGGKTQGSPLVVEPDGDPAQRVLCWLESSLKRVYPASSPGSAEPRRLIIPRNGQVSFQVCLRNERIWPLNANVTVETSEGLEVQVRRVGYVPVRLLTTGVPIHDMDGLEHIPGLVPDPLFPSNAGTVSPFENMAFWITIKAPESVEPGQHNVRIHYSFHEGTQTADLEAMLDVSEFVVEPRHDFPVVHWWRGECFWDYYQTGMFEDERWWTITRNYLENMIDHGTNVIYVPIMNFRRETFKRPCQLLKVTEPEPGRYEFDFSDVKRFVQLARECGAEFYEWSAFWIYWGAENPVRVYQWVDGEAVMLWPPDLDGHGPVFHNFMQQFLPEFHEFLVSEDILEKSFFHVSDEPGEGQHLDNYRKARAFLDEHAPWMSGKIMDALSSIEYGRQGLTDIPIPIISSAPAYIAEDIPHWVYFCCGPTGEYLQRLLDTPLVKVRMSGWLFYNLHARGFLHWGYNYWHALEQERIINPFNDTTGEMWPSIPPGDPLMVYPGPDGLPIDSTRWEIFAESLQDYAVLQTAGIDPSDEMFSEIKDYASFPRSEEWIEERLRSILA